MAGHAKGPFLGGPAGWTSILLPALGFLVLVQHLPAVGAGEALVWSAEWVPSLGATLGIALDGLSLLFGLLITGIGTGVALYASSYLGHQDHYPRFCLYFLMFTAGMLGLVLAADLLTLFVFWEVTTISSYLLIGYVSDDPKSRRNALQALLVTGTGGLALLAGIILIGGAAGTLQIRELGDLSGHPLYVPIALLVLAGAFTKSAQVPFHFWLPNAMAAPTPVSAYLHSATMVKGGVYLMARLSPNLGGTDLWSLSLMGFGGVTAVFASVLAVRQTDIKQLLAYTTLMALGTLTLFLGLGTEYAFEGAMLFLLVHALYKAALFLMIGVVDHGTGTRDARVLRGLAGAMPLTFLAALLAILSMAGLPPLVGFVGKEWLYKAGFGAESGGPHLWALGCAFAASALMVCAAGIAGLRPFLGTRSHAEAHEGPWPMLAAPLLLGGLALWLGIVPDAAEPIVGAAASAVAGAPVAVDLYLFKEVEPALILSVVTLLCGAALYAAHGAVRDRLARLDGRAPHFDPGWDRLMGWVAAGAHGLTATIQTGVLRRYIYVTFAALALMIAAGLWRTGLWPDTIVPEGELVTKHWSVLIFIVAGAMVTAFTHSRMTAVASLGVVGIGVALIFIMFGAPDVAITQLLVETLVVVLVAVAMLKLPPLDRERVRSVRLWDLGLAAALGAGTTVIMLLVQAVPVDRRITDYYEIASYPEAYGQNIVNVILVDFRALDTFGEIAVVAVAALAAYALLRGTRYRGDP